MDQLFLKRQSKRAFSDEPIPEEHVVGMLEAFRWAPSSRNAQPWRVVVTSGVVLQSALSKGNEAWATKAPVAFVICEVVDDIAPDIRKASYAFDIGLATENLILQAVSYGYIGHPTEGWDAALVKQLCGIPESARVACIVFVAKPGDETGLDEITKAKEAKPRTRKELKEIAFKNSWGNPL